MGIQEDRSGIYPTAISERPVTTELRSVTAGESLTEHLKEQRLIYDVR